MASLPMCESTRPHRAESHHICGQRRTITAPFLESLRADGWVDDSLLREVSGGRDPRDGPHNAVTIVQAKSATQRAFTSAYPVDELDNATGLDKAELSIPPNSSCLHCTCTVCKYSSSIGCCLDLFSCCVVLLLHDLQPQVVSWLSSGLWRDSVANDDFSEVFERAVDIITVDGCSGHITSSQPLLYKLVLHLPCCLCIISIQDLCQLSLQITGISVEKFCRSMLNQRWMQVIVGILHTRVSIELCLESFNASSMLVCKWRA